jgi:hypothetical protein
MEKHLRKFGISMTLDFFESLTKENLIFEEIETKDRRQENKNTNLIRLKKMNPRINVAHYDFAKEILGYGLRLIIWLQGCHKRCNECITPEFQALRGGQSMTSGKLFNVIKFISKKCT